MLILEKNRLTKTIDSLQTALSTVRTENEMLEGKMSSTAALIAEKDALVRRVKSQNTREISELRDQVESMRKSETEYVTILAVLRAENNQLKSENAQLKSENSDLRNSNSQLTAKLDDLAQNLAAQIRLTQSARFKASSFRVDVERRKNKLTARAKKARTLHVNFELNDVPEKYQGLQKIYLVIVDDLGNPIAAVNPTKVSVNAPSGIIPIIAQQLKSINLAKNQRLAFANNLEERLRSGNYVAAVYCDTGLLGASSFRLQ